VYFVPTPDGVCFVTPRGTEVFTGRSIHAWVERLAPYLDGHRTVDELTAGLTGERRAMVADTVCALLAKGLCTDLDARVPDSLPPWEIERYAAEIGYLEQFVDSPAAAFQRYRESRFVVVGSGVLGAALVGALARTGVTATRAGDEVSDALLADAEVVLHASDRPMLARALRLDRKCLRHKAILLHATVLDDEVWLGPTGGDWQSAWRRLQDTGARAPFVDCPHATVSRYLTGPAATVVANQMVLMALRRVSGVDDAWTMRRIDLTTLESTDHRFRPHPLAAPPVPGRSMPSAAVDPGDFDRRAARLLDGRLGIVTQLAEADLVQVPLCVATVRVAGRGGPATITAAGPDFRTARLRAALRAAAHYAHTCVDLRRGPDVPGYALPDGTVRPVPAALAFGSGRATGLAAGYTWAEAVGTGVLAHCRALTLAERVAPRPVDLPPDPYRRPVELAGIPVEVHDITGTLGVPTFSFRVDGRTVACTTAVSRADAIHAGLELTLLDHQTGAHHQPESAFVVAGDPAVEPAAAVAALVRAGHAPVAVPLDHDPELVDVVPYVVNVVLAND
jgi:hypothetical protein